MRTAMIGAGHTGSVPGTCFADLPHDISRIDKDAEKIGKLQQGAAPICKTHH
ncbi:hypothetical protein [Bradyrhizobium sp. Ai1a-2]|uniref:hypothetical protein n=1 Tax=Bradyrhizobium sp. Ai1a-2 TaxID=196490 RepID=UPI0004240495|nr:hypothetical protein [Bradyrhizobium sp. Ai1a-2]